MVCPLVFRFEAIRLANGVNQFEGRVEVQINGIWGSVQDYSGNWDNKEALVVCKSLLGAEWTGTVQVHSNAYYGEGDGKVRLSNVECTGNEQDLSECGFVTYGWSHSKEVGVFCDVSTGI